MQNLQKKNRKKLFSWKLRIRILVSRKWGREARCGKIDPQVLNYNTHSEFRGAVAQ